MNKKSRWRLSLVLFLIFLLLPFSFLSLTNASTAIKRDIYDFSRGSYDLLLRPQDSHTPIEKKYGLVEENYLGNGNGGITIAQWRNVLSRKDVEVAAPVAAMGLYRPAQSTFSVPERKDTAIRYTITYSTTDGLNTYPMGEKLIAYVIPDNEHPFGYTTIVSPSIGPNIVRGDTPYFKYPSSYHQVIAIDPEQEGLLTGEKLPILNESKSGLIDNFKGVPILSLKNTTNPLKASIQIDTFNMSKSELDDLKKRNEIDYSNGWGFESILLSDEEQYQQIMNEMKEVKVESSKNVELDFSKLATPFYDDVIYADKNYQFYTFEERPIYDGTVGAGSYAVYNQKSNYFVDPVDYNLSSNKISIPQKGKDPDTGVPLYRNIHENINYVMKEMSNEVKEGEGIQFIHSGYFKGIDNSNELAASPLGIYGIHKTHLAKNKDKIIFPTSIPGSFINTPAHGLISINWAEQLKGTAPIDAIRVRVAGIEGYDKASSEKIKKIARELENDGFTVDIVAGASRKDMVIEVEGIGDVVQAWTTLGAADTIVESWDIVKIILSALFGLVSILYLLFSLRQLKKNREADEALLDNFGWTQSTIKRLRWKEWSELIGFPFIMVLLILFMISIMNNSYLLVAILLLVGTVIVLLSGILEVIVRRKSRNVERTRDIPGPLTWKNVWHYRNQIIFSIAQVSIMTFVANFLTIVLMREKARTTETTLGMFIHAEMDWFYTIILVLLYILVCMTVVESLLALWKQRSEEITLFHYLGWGRKELYIFYLREVFLWTLGAVIIGGTFACVAYELFFGNAQAEGWKLTFLSSGILVLVTLISFLILVLALRYPFTLRTREERLHGNRSTKLEQDL